AIIGAVSDDGKVRVMGMGKSVSKGVKRGVVLNIEETAAAIQEAVYQAQLESKLTFKEVYVGIAGQHIKSMKNRHSKYIQSADSEITQADIDELLNDMHNIALDAGEEIIHVIPQSYTVDNEGGVKQPVGMFGKRLEANFHIVVGEISSAKHIFKCIERAGLKVKKMILEPLASASSVLTSDEKEIGVAMVDIGGGTTDIAIYYDGILRHTAVIPFGGDVITRDIKEGCSILHRQAEKIKVQFGTALGDAAPEDQVVSVPGISGASLK
ncbi:MAG: cell division protein FtsA, partial [Chloroflexia bacterium]|nr:cell division protein FtsA [Chloroflexia bacterium]